MTQLNAQACDDATKLSKSYILCYQFWHFGEQYCAYFSSLIKRKSLSAIAKIKAKIWQHQYA